MNIIVLKSRSTFYHSWMLWMILMCQWTIVITQSSNNNDSDHHHHLRTSSSSTSSCACGKISERPNIWDKVATARWMVHHIDWGVLTTISSRRNTTSSHNQVTVVPFGNIYSFVDGSCSKSTGIPYFYGTYMDQTLQDMIHNPVASLTLSEASIDTSCMSSSSTKSKHQNPIHQACRIVPETYAASSTTSKQSHRHHNHTKTISTSSGDPESPICARLTLTGILEVVPMYSLEYNTTLYIGFYIRHPQMSHWPLDHNWMIFKLNINDIWLINYFGGATILTPEEYFNFDAAIQTDTIEVNDPI